jgi:hypothetical protein
MNIKLLRQIQKHILKEPSQYDQTTVAVHSACGTAACIGGWAVILGTKMNVEEINENYISLRAAEKLLQLTPLQANRLFADMEQEESFNNAGWPADLWSRYENAKTAKTRAKVGAERIERFIKTKGRE